MKHKNVISAIIVNCVYLRNNLNFVVDSNAVRM